MDAHEGPGSTDHGLDPDWWEERYRSQDGARLHPPNPYLVETAAALEPGAALDAGCGEGTEAIWLAGNGWQVTALDVSQTALDRARERAEAAGVGDRITWVRAELSAWTAPDGGFDLVCSHYAHPTGPAEQMVRQLAAAVRPGGTLLVVGHQRAAGDEHEGHGHAGHGRGHGHDGHGHDGHGHDGHGHDGHGHDGHGHAAGTVTAALDPSGWEVLAAGHRSRETGPGRRLDDAVVVARRR